jgi:hypothetical protein
MAQTTLSQCSTSRWMPLTALGGVSSTCPPGTTTMAQRYLDPGTARRSRHTGLPRSGITDRFRHQQRPSPHAQHPNHGALIR